MKYSLINFSWSRECCTPKLTSSMRVCCRVRANCICITDKKKPCSAQLCCESESKLDSKLLLIHTVFCFGQKRHWICWNNWKQLLRQMVWFHPLKIHCGRCFQIQII